MQRLWETSGEAGPVAGLVLIVGLVGALTSIVALLLVATRSSAAIRIGAVAAVLGAAAAGLGGAGVVHRRSITEAAIAGDHVRPLLKERLRREGYREARSAAKIGLLFAALPLLAGATAMFVGLR